MPPTGYSLPPNRADATSLLHELHSTLESSAGDRMQTEEAWQRVFVELVRQVYVHCTERGELLEAVRVRYDAQLQLQQRIITEQLRDIKQLRGTAQLMKGCAPRARRGETNEAAQSTAEPANSADPLRKRLDLIMEAADSLHVSAKSTLVEELFTGASIDEKQLVRAPGTRCLQPPITICTPAGRQSGR